MLMLWPPGSFLQHRILYSCTTVESTEFASVLYGTTLKNPTGGATSGVLKSALIRITNNDNPNGEIEFV